MEDNQEKFIEYCRKLADEFFARLNKIRIYVPEHNLTSGNANELMLRDFLSGFSAKQYEVGQGFICDPTIPEHVSKQCDILVYDAFSYPLVDHIGEVKVVRPRSVKLVIEVKTKLNKDALYDALENISTAKKLPYMNMNVGVIFAFNSLKAKTIIKHLRKYSKRLPMEHSPMVIFLMEEGTIIHRWSPIGSLGIDDPEQKGDVYQVRKSNEDNPGAIVVAFLLLLFFEVQLGNAASPTANMAHKILQARTEKISEAFSIGDLSQESDETV